MKCSFPLFRRVALWSVLSVGAVFSFGQDGQDYANEPSVKSPTVAAFSIYGAIPVSMYNGSAQISVPLTQIDCGSIHLPIALSYNSSGNKADQHPGLVGLGWTLKAGGVISRNVNGLIDEWMWVTKDVGYADKRSLLASSSWNTPSFVQSNSLDLAPDEFQFNVGNLSGSFYLNYDGTWKVKSKNGRYVKIEHELTENLAWWGIGTIPRVFSKFIITSDDGFKYIFGGSINIMEFSMPALRYVPLPSDPTYYQRHPAIWNMQTTAWHLTDIISPTKDSIHFYYSDKVPNVYQVNYTNLSYAKIGSQTFEEYSPGLKNKHLVLAHYLDSIKTNNGVSILFNKSLSNELRYVDQVNPYVTEFGMYALSPGQDNYYKLDSITVKYDNTIRQRMKLDYIENTSERLKLKQVNFNSTANDSTYSYRFEYDSLKLPIYNSGKTDHWGFYNNRSYSGCCSQPTDNGAAYFASREPDTTYARAEMLTKIIYPSKGFTSIIYEPHSYSKYVYQADSIGVIDNSVNKYAGGVRVKKIISADDITGVQTVKEYYYTRDYINGGTLSSGVLNGVPKYYQSGTNAIDGGGSVTFWKLNSQSFNNLNDADGSHISYSEVVERTSGQGYTVHTFSNHDNGYANTPPFATYFSSEGSDTYLFKNKTVGKRELERGLELFTRMYSEDKVLLKEVENRYNADPARFNDYVRAVQVSSDIQNYGVSKVAYPIYTFYPYLDTKIVREFTPTGNVENTQSYTYDNSYRLLRTSMAWNSKNELTKDTLTYVFDVATPGDVYSKMVGQSMLGSVVESAKAINDTFTIKKKIDYFEGNAGIYVPEKIYESFSDKPLQLVAQLYRYDGNGNLLEIARKNSYHSCYIWDYHNRLVISKIENAAIDEVAFTSFETEDGKGGWTFTNNSFDATGGPNIKVTVPMTTNRAYALGASSGITKTGLNNTKTYRLTFWNYNSEPQLSVGTLVRKRVVKQMNGWKLFEVVFQNTTSITISATSGSDCILDELRLAPVNAKMVTYAYDPLIGITVETDENLRSTFYYYDGFNRLRYLKDQDGNILKTYQYNYKQ